MKLIGAFHLAVLLAACSDGAKAQHDLASIADALPDRTAVAHCIVNHPGFDAGADCIEWATGWNEMSSATSSLCYDLETTKYYPTGGCDLTDAVGGCVSASSNGTQTTYYYEPMTSAAVMATCADDGETFVTP